MELKRTLHLRNAIMMVVGNVVGAGIFTTGGLLAANVSHPWLYIVVWIVGGFLTLCGALTYAELGAMFPKAGGDYQFLKEAYGPLVGFIVGWLLFLIIMPGSIAALSIAMVKSVPGMVDDPISVKAIAAGLIAGLTVINCRGARLAGNTQDVITIGSLLVILAMVVFGFAGGKGSFDNFAASNGIESIQFKGGALIAVIFTYSGWFASAYIASEIKNPGRNVPLSLFIGTVIITVLYTLVNCVYIYGVSIDEMRGVEHIGVLVAQRLFDGPGRWLVTGAILLAILSCINATVMTGSRVYYAMAVDGLFWEKCKEVHPKFGTPVFSLLVQAFVAIVLVFAGTFDLLLHWVGFAMLISCMGTGVALLVLRRTMPKRSRPYRVTGYPIVPLIFVASYGFIGVAVSIESPMTSLASIGLLILGVPFYYLWQRMKKKKAENTAS